MKIALLAAGAGAMYCGSCLRDHTLATALAEAGQEVDLLPLYTPLRTDEPGLASCPVFLGGANAYLRHKYPAFRYVPRFVARLLDSPAVLGLAGRLGGMTSAAGLGSLAVSVLHGDHGDHATEIERLVEFLADLKPDVVHLPNTLLTGLAGPIRRTLGVPIICSLTGEDVFVDSLPAEYRQQVIEIIHKNAGDVDAFIASSAYYADRAASMFSIPRPAVRVVWSGIRADDFAAAQPSRSADTPTIGYLARICPEKGLDILCEAVEILRKHEGMGSARLCAAGYLGPADKEWFDNLRTRLDGRGMADAFEYIGEVDRQGKIDFLSSVDVLSVPTRYPEAKGIYLLEALAAGVPIVQPEHGSFPELVQDTGGVLVPPGDPGALADAFAVLLRDPERRQRLGQAGRRAVLERYTAQRMAAEVLSVYRNHES
ncbi:MAG: glycosyltransferase family 4 protein [Planctomycetes bacterium]|nr:glycosyltransferase family 4 protein [Planctomycetota bacterium]